MKYQNHALCSFLPSSSNINLAIHKKQNAYPSSKNKHKKNLAHAHGARTEDRVEEQQTDVKGGY